MNNLKFLKFKSNDRLWFFSDPHFGHSNIVLGTTKWQEDNKKNCRNFENPAIMDETIINNINEKVGRDDVLFCLGDWAWAGVEGITNYRKRINCKNLHLILGNHDQEIRNNEKLQHLFTTCRDYMELNIDEHHVIMKHFPIESWCRMHKGSFHLFGHQHLREHLKIKPGRKMDVGVDGNNFQPYSWSEIYDLLKDRSFLKDHENENRETI